MGSTEIIERHFSEAGFLWSLRDAAVRDPAYTLAALTDLDSRVEAHLDALVLADADGRAICDASLEEPDARSVFTAMFVATAGRDAGAVEQVLDLADSADLARAAAAALAWASFSDANYLLPRLLDPKAPAVLQQLGIAACAAHTHDPEGALDRALGAQEGSLRARALRAVGQLGRKDLAQELALAYSTSDGPERFWASWAGALLGDTAASDRLLSLASSETPFATRACETAMRTSPPGIARRWLEPFIGSNRPRLALVAAAALGDPAMVPWVLELMAVPELARAAGRAMQSITGADPALPRFRAKASEGFSSGPSDDPDDEEVAPDPDESLVWPNREAIQCWWAGVGADFQPGARHFFGKPIATPGWLEQVLRLGSQPARAAAAEELAIARQQGPLFDVRGPASRQRKGAT